MDDQNILGRIDEMIAAEHKLRATSDHGPEERRQQRELEENLDQCWDLLRQRRAQREFGADPEAARARPVQEVEGYLQ